MLFEADTAVLIFVISIIIGSFIAAGVLLGRRMRSTATSDQHRESLGVVQGALLGLVGLLLAFGLTMAVTRYEVRRDVLVEEANAIGTTYSAKYIKERIAHHISRETERTVLSDDALVEALKQEGIDAARRTVAKYREAMNIPSSAQRRRGLKAAL